jgi:hypothetical protein
MEVNGQDVNKLKAQAEQAMEQKRQIDADMEAARQRSIALIDKVRIPAEKPDACEHSGKAGTRSQCDERLGALAIKAGDWEITTETTSKTIYPGEPKSEPKKTKSKAKTRTKEKEKAEDRTMHTDVTTDTRKECLSPDSEPLTGEQMKRSSNVVTWKSAETREAGGITVKEEHEGGIEYKGDSFEGGKIHRHILPSGQTISYTRVTGKRLGDGNCSTGREGSSKSLTGREASSRKISDENANTPAKIIDNSTRKLKSFFGF